MRDIIPSIFGLTLFVFLTIAVLLQVGVPWDELEAGGVWTLIFTYGVFWLYVLCCWGREVRS